MSVIHTIFPIASYREGAAALRGPVVAWNDDQMTSGGPQLTKLIVLNLLVFTCVSYAEARNRYRLDVRPSVRLSVTRWYCIKTAERIVMISSPHDSPFIVVLRVPRSSRNSDGVTPYGGAKQRQGIKIARFSRNKSLYLANDTRYRHGCYGGRIGNRTQAFEWHQFQ